MGKYDDLPQDLIERAIAELNREIPERDVLIERLGKFGHEVEAFVMRLEAIKFFTNVGEPIRYQSEEKVKRVRDWDSAIEVSLEEEHTLITSDARRLGEKEKDEVMRRDLAADTCSDAPEGVELL